MNEGLLVSVIALLGWLILMSRSGVLREMGGKRKLVMAVTWAAVFVAVALVYRSIQ